MNKKYTLNLLGALVFSSASVFAAETPLDVGGGGVDATSISNDYWREIEALHPFIGVKSGWQIGDDDAYHHHNPSNHLWGVFTGFQFTPAWRWDVGYQSHGELKSNATGAKVKTDLWETAVRYDWYFSDDVSLYARAGLAYWDMDKSGSINLSESGFSPLGETGVNYRLTPHLLLNAGYQYIHDIGKGDGSNGTIGSYNSHGFLVGLTYDFGSTDESTHASQPVAEPVVVEPVVVEPPVTETLKGSTLFATNSSVLKPSRELDRLVDRLLTSQYGEIKVIGYTDSRGAAKYNQWISVRRAQSVANYLIKKGVSPAKIHVIGRGESHPVANNKTAIGRAKNRRVEVTILNLQPEKVTTL
ncbi:OmpA family protein [Vibrio rumoiensis]|uniref:OmpA family protein n=1 Tax=Vibrio rumoiensis TaxID=76258 RepID=UPI003AA8CCDC